MLSLHCAHLFRGIVYNCFRFVLFSVRVTFGPCYIRSVLFWSLLFSPFNPFNLCCPVLKLLHIVVFRLPLSGMDTLYIRWVSTEEGHYIYIICYFRQQKYNFWYLEFIQWHWAFTDDHINIKTVRIAFLIHYLE